jgi:hypothetical protein
LLLLELAPSPPVLQIPFRTLDPDQTNSYWVQNNNSFSIDIKFFLCLFKKINNLKFFEISGCKKVRITFVGSGIRDKHPGSATLIPSTCYLIWAKPLSATRRQEKVRTREREVREVPSHFRFDIQQAMGLSKSCIRCYTLYGTSSFYIKHYDPFFICSENIGFFCLLILFLLFSR